MAKVELLTAAFNRLEYTVMCVREVNRLAGMDDYMHVIVDQGSTDGTGAWLRSLSNEGYYKIRPIYNKENTGDAGGLSDGLASIGDDCKYVMHFGNDCMPITPGFLKQFVDVMDAHPEIGAVMPRRTGVINKLVPDRIDIVDGLEMGTLPERKHVVCAIMRRSLLDSMPEPRREGANIHWVQAQTKRMKAAGYAVYKCMNIVIDHIDGTYGQHQKYPLYFAYKPVELSNLSTVNYQSTNKRRLMTRSDFDAIALKCDYYMPARYGYLERIISMLKSMDYESILEIGAFRQRLDHDSVVMDIASYLPATVLHDADCHPWPFPDKSFDVIVASQMVEHLNEKPGFFREAQRVCRSLIISLPYKWTNGSECHRNIDENVIATWTTAIPQSSARVGCRLIQRYDFSN
jgi:glycosyltransferase involved in cell wall biosynthesis